MSFIDSSFCFIGTPSVCHSFNSNPWRLHSRNTFCSYSDATNPLMHYTGMNEWEIIRLPVFLYDNHKGRPNRSRTQKWTLTPTENKASLQVSSIVPRGSFTAKIGAYMHIYSRFLLRVLGLLGDAKPSAYPDKSTYNRQNKERVQYWTQVAVRYQCSPPRLSVEAN